MSAKHDDLVREIRLFISEIGGVSIKTDTPGLLFDKIGRPVKVGTKGVLDVHACVRGRFVAIDAKIGKDRLSSDQRRYAHAVEAKGGIAIAAHSIEDVRSRLVSEGLIHA